MAAITAFYLVESWQGRRAWAAYQAEAKAAGEQLEASAVIPKPIPDEENLAMAPLFLRLYADDGEYRRAESKDPTHINLLASLKITGEGEAPEGAGSWLKGERTDLQAWAEYLAGNSEDDSPNSATVAALTVLEALERFEPVMQELEDAAARPRTRFPIHYDDGIYMHFQVAPLHDLAKIARLRASARLATGDTAGAYKDVHLVLRLADATSEIPTLLMGMFGISQSDLAMAPLWEGLLTHQWSDEQLREFQGVFAVKNYAAQFRQRLRTERNLAGFTLIDVLRRKPEETDGIFGLKDEGGKWHLLAPAVKLAPDGWFDLNKAELGRFVGQMLSFAESSPPRFFPEEYQAFRDYLNGPGNAFHHPRRIIAELVARTFIEGVPRTAAAQGIVDLTLIALALERHWLRHGEYPETLGKLDQDLLSSRGIPTDCATGRPPRYSREVDGTFTLYYDGWNEEDDEGTMIPREPPSTSIYFTNGDWVWPQLAE